MKLTISLADADRARVLARYRSLHGRGGLKIKFEPLGPLVVATNPSELEAATVDALAEIACRDSES